MRARKRNQYWGEGLDKRQARRRQRRNRSRQFNDMDGQRKGLWHIGYHDGLGYKHLGRVGDCPMCVIDLTGLTTKENA